MQPLSSAPALRQSPATASTPQQRTGGLKYAPMTINLPVGTGLIPKDKPFTFIPYVLEHSDLNKLQDLAAEVLLIYPPTKPPFLKRVEKGFSHLHTLGAAITKDLKPIMIAHADTGSVGPCKHHTLWASTGWRPTEGTTAGGLTHLFASNNEEQNAILGNLMTLLATHARGEQTQVAFIENLPAPHKVNDWKQEFLL